MAPFYVSQRGLFALESLFLRRRRWACVSVRQHAIWTFETKWIGFTPPALAHTNISECPNRGMPPLSVVTLHRIRGDGLMDEFPERQCNLWHHGAVCTPYPRPPSSLSSLSLFLSLGRELPLLGDNTISLANMNLGRMANEETSLSFLTSGYWLCFAGGMDAGQDAYQLGGEARQNETNVQNSGFWVYHLTAK